MPISWFNQTCRAPHSPKKYSDVFDGIGQLPGECEIYLRPNATPVVHPPRRVPVALRDKLKAELDRMERDQEISKVNEPTDWVNSLVIVEKPNGSLHVCLDPKDLNDAIKWPYYPNKTLEDILPDLTDAKVFSKFDARSGYWSMPEKWYLCLAYFRLVRVELYALSATPFHEQVKISIMSRSVLSVYYNIVHYCLNTR